MAWPSLPNVTFAARCESSSGPVSLFFHGPHIIPVNLEHFRSPQAVLRCSKFPALAVPSAKESSGLCSRANRTVRYFDLITLDTLVDDLLRLNLFNGSYSIFEYPGVYVPFISALFAASANIGAKLKSEERLSSNTCSCQSCRAERLASRFSGRLNLLKTHTGQLMIL